MARSSSAPPSAQSSTHPPFVASPAAASPSLASAFLSLQHVNVALPDGRVLLDDISHDFSTARHGLIGRNGAGKSVLLRVMLGALPPQSGRVVRHGRMAHVPQTPS